jgi:predicted metal-binding membrane protein
MAESELSVLFANELGRGVTDLASERLAHLTPSAARLGAVFARPRVIAALCVVSLAGLGWVYLGLVAGSAIARGGDLFDLIRALCGPLGSFGMPAANPWGATDLALVFAMWAAMSLAMMLPSAAPMILTYAEIADTAVRKRAPVVTPFALASGYATVWLSFAFAAALLQALLTHAALIDAAMLPVSRPLSGALFVLAGAYQFSSLKQSCLRACQRPFPFFFANWKTTAFGVFGLGVRQGMHCLGCCWAMMLLMFAVGVMNVAWMAALAIVMTIEKMTVSKRFSRALGVALIGIGLAVLGADIVLRLGM